MTHKHRFPHEDPVTAHARLSAAAKPGSPSTSTPKRQPERPGRLRRANIKSWMA